MRKLIPCTTNKSADWTIAAVALTLLGTLMFSAAAANENDDIPYARGDDPAGVLIGWGGQPTQWIYPVVFTHIDGQTIADREVLYLKPGEYEVQMRSFIKNAPGLRRSSARGRQEQGYNRITVVVEEGKRYHIGMKQDRTRNIRPLKAVVYKVEDTNPGDDE